MEENREKLPKLSEVEEHETNPFMFMLKGKMYLQPTANTVLARGQEIIDTTTGEVISDDVLIGRKRVVDKSHFAKIYASEIGLLFDLSKVAINVLMYITKAMDYDNRVYFDFYKEYGKIGYKSYVSPMKGVRELIGANIIAKDVRANTYWINPTIICKGERFSKYVLYVTEERERADQEKRLKQNMLKDQGQDYYDNLDNETQYKLEAMNQRAEDEYNREAISDPRIERQRTLFESNPYATDQED